jgi:hypothetical protein
MYTTFPIIRLSDDIFRLDQPLLSSKPMTAKKTKSQCMPQQKFRALLISVLTDKVICFTEWDAIVSWLCNRNLWIPGVVGDEQAFLKHPTHEELNISTCQ